MAKVTVHVPSLDLDVDTAHLRVADDDDFAEAVRQLPQVQKQLWAHFLNQYEVVQAGYDEPEPDDTTGEPA